MEKQFAATLYYVADEGRMGKLSNVFGIGKSTVLKVIRLVTQAISKYLGKKCINYLGTRTHGIKFLLGPWLSTVYWCSARNICWD